MGGWKEKMERWFAAVAFAEQNRHGEAMEVGGLEAVKAEFSLERVFAAAAFAEENSPEIAMEILGVGEANSNPQDFASVVGLRGVRIWYGVAHLAA